MGFFSKLFKKKDSTKEINNKKGNINEWSFQRFAGFYDERVFPDPKFNEKIESIKHCINNKHIERIDEIANESGCTFEETVMKIRYLKNKRVFDNIYIDRFNKAVKRCSEEDEKILEKYYTMLYVDHFSISEMAQRVPNFHNKPIPIIEEDVYKDIKYLYDKCIINGIKLDEERKEIIYYTVEKHKKAQLYATVNCPKCGALVDVSKGGNGRCDYCGSIAEDTTDGNFS
jgi:DNA-directed RNA polymerase subunit RPC12/RpoP